MRTLIVPIVLLLLLSGCASDRFLVESDYSYRSDFKRYRNFAVVSGTTTETDSSMSNAVIAREIENRMRLQGYKSTEKKPNLLVFHKIFYDDLVEFRGFHQPQMESWIKEEVDEENDAVYDPVKYNLKKGTLLIQLVDSRKHNVVWQGYASGLFTEQNLDDERYLRRAVRNIFDQYRAFAEGYLREDKAN